MQTFIFETPFEGRVDRDLGVIRGVSLITGGLTARGHELVVDDTTISQIFQSASSKGNVPVKLDHKSGVENVCGFVTSFRIEGNKLLGDWHLLRSHPHYETTMEKAERMPGCFGLSAAFVGKEEERDGKKFARCQELLAVDCVTQPAANPTGLFSRRVDTSTNVSPQTQLNTPMPPQAPIPPAADQNQELVALRQENAELNERLEVVEHFCASIHDAMGAGEDLPAGDAGADDQGQADLAAINAGMVELTTKVTATEGLLTVRDAKIVELETQLAAVKGDKGGIAAVVPAAAPVVAAAPAAGATEAGAVRLEVLPAAADAPKLTAFETKVELAVKGGKARSAAIKELVSTEPKLFSAHLEEKGVIALGS